MNNPKEFIDGIPENETHPDYQEVLNGWNKMG